MAEHSHDWEIWLQSIAQKLKQIDLDSQQVVVKKSYQTNQWLKAFHHIADALRSTENIKQTLTHIAHKHTFSQNSFDEEIQLSSQTESTEEALYELFQSPMMSKIVNDVMKLRKDRC